MMSPSGMSGGQSGYYLGLAQSDYYLEGGEPPGMWYGVGAEKLGLAQDSQVQTSELENLFKGFHPHKDDEKLVQNAGKMTGDRSRQPGTDTTFSAPKSVSVAWSQGDRVTQLEIQAAQQEAVAKAIDYLQDKAAFTRTGKGGIDREKVALVVATFEHGTSRAGDPQLHTHALIMNVGVRANGKTSTIESKPFFYHAKAAGAVYRAELAHQLEARLGLQAERRQEGWGFELKGVDKALIETFSKRREAIEAKLKELGFSSAKASEVAALDTRKTKVHRCRKELFEEWGEIGKEHGWSTEELNQLVDLDRAQARDFEEVKEELIEEVKATISQRSTFHERDVVAAFADLAPHYHLSSDEVRNMASDYLHLSGEVLELGRGHSKDEVLYTTKDLALTEEKLLDSLWASREEKGFSLPKSVADRAVLRVEETLTKEKGEAFFLNQEQRDAVEHIVEKEGRVACVTGMAGTGKTTMLQAAFESWDAMHKNVRGVALNGKAAQGLHEETGMDTSSIAKLLYDTDWSEKTWDVDEARKNFEAYKLEQIAKGNERYETMQFNARLSEKWFYENRPENPFKKMDVLVVDEAAMVDTYDTARLVEETKKHQVKLVLVGDAGQLQSIGTGGAFRAATDLLGEAKLTEIFRQRDFWAREAVHDFANANVEEALLAYNKEGLLTLADDRNKARSAMVSAWSKDGGIEAPEKALLIAALRQEVRELNWDAQAARQLEGKLGEHTVKASGYDFCQNDRIVFTERSKKLGVENGQFGTVSKLNLLKKQLTVKLDNGTSVRVSVKEFKGIALGYATTTHKAQGATIDKVYVLAGGAMQDRELTYVQMSRSKESTHLFTDKETAGPYMRNLKSSMKRSNQKELALSRAARMAEEREKQQQQDYALSH